MELFSAASLHRDLISEHQQISAVTVVPEPRTFTVFVELFGPMFRMRILFFGRMIVL